MEGASQASGDRVCRRCLMKELGMEEYLESVRLCRERMPPRERTPDKEYQARLAACRECVQLVNATCQLCGCYVEIRAAKRSARCPASPRRWG